MTRTILAAAALAAAAISALPAAAFEAGRIQDISVSSRHGGTVMSQFYAPAASNVSSAHTRVCLVNLGPHSRAFTHAQPGINALVAKANGGKSCANFPATARVAFGMQDGAEPATPGVAMVMSLGAFKSGTVTFVWN